MSKKDEKTHWKKQFNYDYLGSYSLPGGKDVILTIKETKKELVTGQKGQKEQLFVCYFEQKEEWVKPMILNRTNCKTIEHTYNTPFIEDWRGLKIKIGIEKVSAFGEIVEGLRIRGSVISNEKPELVPSMEAWSGAVKFLQENGTVDKIELKYKLSNENRKLLINTI